MDLAIANPKASRIRLSRRELSRLLIVALVAGITIVALGLRLFMLGEWSFWGDEMITLGRAANLSGLKLSQ